VLTEFFAHRGIAQAALPDGGSIALRFTSAVDEHLATRRGVGLFDFSFMGWWQFSGREARACLERLQTRELAALAPGKGCYTLLCREDGSVFIDATVWCLDTERYWLFTGRRTDASHLAACASSFDVDVEALFDRYAVIAVQGPASAALLARALPQCAAESLGFFAFRPIAIDGQDAWIARLGYTGELGYELLVAEAAAVSLWKRLTQLPFDGVRLECGMEAANSLRIEAGFIHFAYELRLRVLPAELGLSRLVRTGHAEFIGALALRRIGQPTRRLAGIVLAHGEESDRVAPVSAASPRVHLTSEAWSPTFERALGLAFVDASLDHGAVVPIDDGRTGVLADLPFYARQASQAKH
jgi:aminomethyltransferase